MKKSKSERLDQNNFDNKVFATDQEKVDSLKANILNLTFEESMKELDLIIEGLQKDSVHLDELQTSYMKGKIYLEHCQSLLDKVEQDVLHLNPDDLESFN